jgi:hypothetical protein
MYWRHICAVPRRHICAAAHICRSEKAHTVCAALKNFCIFELKKTNKKVEFVLDHYERFLKVSPKSVEKVALVTNGLTVYSCFIRFILSRTIVPLFCKYSTMPVLKIAKNTVVIKLNLGSRSRIIL